MIIRHYEDFHICGVAWASGFLRDCPFFAITHTSMARFEKKKKKEREMCYYSDKHKRRTNHSDDKVDVFSE